MANTIDSDPKGENDAELIFEYWNQVRELQREFCLKYAHLGITQLMRIIAPYAYGEEYSMLYEDLTQYLKDQKPKEEKSNQT
jgi:hypothetical protein